MSSESLKFSDFEKIFPPTEGKPKPIQMASSGGLKTRILLGEEDPVHTLTVFQALVDSGYEVVVAAEGSHVLSELRKSDHPPVAVLDAQLSRLNPADLCQRMRDAEKTIYLVFFSENPESQEIVAGLEAGADLWLPKSTPIPELIAHLHAGLRIIDRERAMGQRIEALKDAPSAHL